MIDLAPGCKRVRDRKCVCTRANAAARERERERERINVASKDITSMVDDQP